MNFHPKFGLRNWCPNFNFVNELPHERQVILGTEISEGIRSRSMLANSIMHL